MRLLGSIMTAILFIWSLSLQCLSQQKSQQATSSPRPQRLEIIGGTTFDFGDLYRGQKATHFFTIKNAGDDTLVIRNVSASCGCTAAMASRSVVPPQSTSKLNVTFNSEGYGGRVRKTVTVHSNDPVSPTQQASIAANVLPVLESSPSYLFIQRAKVDSVSLSSIQVTNATGKQVTILSVESNLEGSRVEATKKALKPSEKAELRVSYKPAKEGPAYGEIIVKTDFQPQPTVSIRLTANAYN
jgi:hypothetical protein